MFKLSYSCLSRRGSNALYKKWRLFARYPLAPLPLLPPPSCFCRPTPKNMMSRTCTTTLHYIARAQINYFSLYHKPVSSFWSAIRKPSTRVSGGYLSECPPDRFGLSNIVKTHANAPCLEIDGKTCSLFPETPNGGPF